MAPKKRAKKVEEKETPKVTQEQFQQSAAQAIQNYFTKDINDQVHEMTNDVMFALLRQLEGSEYWIPLLRYNNLRLLNAQSAINSMDPMTQGSTMRLQQGCMMGIVDLQNAIITMVEAEKEAEREAREIAETF